MLLKDVNGSRMIRGVLDSSVSNCEKRKNCSEQTTNLDSFGSSTIISVDGKISKNDQNNYKKAIDFVNGWNKAMDEYMKKNASIKRQEAGECSDVHDELSFGTLPNYMALFLAIHKVETEYRQSVYHKKPLKKNTFTQTISPQRRIDVKSQTQYVKFAEKTTEHPKNIENIPEKIQQSQYATYSHSIPQKLQKTPRILKNLKHCPTLRHSAIFIESNTGQTSPRHSDSDLTCYKSINSPVQSFANLSSPSSIIGRGKRAVTGLLSPNAMIASKINANGTPIIVKEMFEKVQNPLGISVSQGNSLRNISRSWSCTSSVILSDKENEIKIQDKHGVEQTSSIYGHEKQYDGDGFDHQGLSSGCGEEYSASKHHPLTLNERDLNSKDRNFISSIGIFTESGELNLNAKTYLERKDDVRRGPFRAPRLSQLHRTEHYSVKSCDSGSLLSDILSTRSSEIYD